MGTPVEEIQDSLKSDKNKMKTNVYFYLITQFFLEGEMF
jgi:hypothetical protein